MFRFNTVVAKITRSSILADLFFASLYAGQAVDMRGVAVAGGRKNAVIPLARDRFAALPPAVVAYADGYRRYCKQGKAARGAAEREAEIGAI